MTDDSRKSRKNFLGRFRELVAEFGGCEDVELKDTIHIASRKIRVPSPVIPLQIMLGGEQGKRLFLYPEIKLTEGDELSGERRPIALRSGRFFFDHQRLSQAVRGRVPNFGPRECPAA